ncbi:MAG: zinc-ribbon domain-containing protein, partial [Desulfobacterales bacterium]|nr:zinc-ribbon domain-containing protein [Desulfobacterales bacterium]
MIITCEECSTRFNLDDSLIRPEGSKVRCSQCKHVFTAFPEPETPSEIPAPVSDEGPDPDEIPDPGIDPGGADIAPPDVEAPVSEEVEFDDPDSLSQTAGDGFDDITFDEPEMSEEPVPAIPDTDETDTEDTDAESPDFDFDLDEFDQDEFDQDEFDQDMDFGLEEEPDADQDDTSDFPVEPGGIEDSGLEMETAEETDLREEEVSEDIDFEFEETEISFDDDEIEFEDDNLGFEDTLKAIDDLDSEGFETGDPEDGGIDSLEVDTMETVEMEPDTGFDNLEMEADTIQEGEIELEEPGLEMEEAEPAPEEIQFDEPAEIEFDEPEFDEPGFDEPEDIEFDEPELEDSETEFPDLEFEESKPDSGDETADIEISFDDEDDSPELADLPLEMEPADEIEFEETALPTDVVGDEDEKILGEIDFQGLESDDDEEPDLELSFEEDPDADLVFEEETDEPAPETELPESGVDEPPAPMDMPPVFEEDNEEFQASLDAELEEDKFAGYDQVLNQEVEPGQEPASAQDLTEPPPLPPELPPESEEPAPQQESPQQESPLIEPLPEEDVRKRRTRQKKAAIGAPVKVIFLLFLIVIAAYG